MSIYAENRRRKFYGLSSLDQLRNFGYWDMTFSDYFPDCYFYKKENLYILKGIIASSRTLDISNKIQTVVCFLGVGPKKYIEIRTVGKYFNQKHIGFVGKAKLIDNEFYIYEAVIGKYF